MTNNNQSLSVKESWKNLMKECFFTQLEKYNTMKPIIECISHEEGRKLSLEIAKAKLEYHQCLYSLDLTKIKACLKKLQDLFVEASDLMIKNPDRNFNIMRDNFQSLETHSREGGYVKVSNFYKNEYEKLENFYNTTKEILG